jgi:putative DNA methylase
MEYHPTSLGMFLNEAQFSRDKLRLVAQALAGPGLKGKSDDEAKVLLATTSAEQAALGKLLANWRGLIEQPIGPLFGSR